MIYTICDLRQKEVINICDGQRLGYICDVEINTECGKVCSVIIPGPCKVWGILGREQEYVIPYNCIKQIGSDVILVEVNFENIVRKCEKCD